MASKTCKTLVVGVSEFQSYREHFFMLQQLVKLSTTKRMSGVDGVTLANGAL
jgi:hypothetical protein